MKKITLWITLSSAAITAAMFALNMFLGKLTGSIIGIELWGGEVCETIGFGVCARKFYPLTTADSVSSGSRTSVSVEPISLIVTFLICMAAGLIVYSVRKLFRRKKFTAAEQKNQG